MRTSMGLREGRPLLDVVVTHEAECPTLSEYRSVIVARTVAETKGDAGGDMIATHDLRYVTCRDAGTVQSFEC